VGNYYREYKNFSQRESRLLQIEEVKAMAQRSMFKTIRSNETSQISLVSDSQNHKRRMLTEKLDGKGARLEHTPRKSLKRLAQETGVSKSSARTATQLLKPSSESWFLVCCKCKKHCCTCVFLTKQLIVKYIYV
jgi:hypothetical protein